MDNFSPSLKNLQGPRTAEKLKTRTEAILIKPSTGRSFAEVLSNHRSKTKPEDPEEEIKVIWCSRDGHSLLKLKSVGVAKSCF